MGAWGAGAFEDDAGQDWLDGPFEQEGSSAVIAAFDRVMAVEPGAALGYDAGAAARAAAEVVAIVHGHAPAGLDDETRTAILTKAAGLRRTDGIAARATDALARVWADGSELHELWMEDPDGAGAEWNGAMSDLTARLGRARRG